MKKYFPAIHFLKVTRKLTQSYETSAFRLKSSLNLKNFGEVCKEIDEHIKLLLFLSKVLSILKKIGEVATSSADQELLQWFSFKIVKIKINFNREI